MSFWNLSRLRDSSFMKFAGDWNSETGSARWRWRTTMEPSSHYHPICQSTRPSKWYVIYLFLHYRWLILWLVFVTIQTGADRLYGYSRGKFCNGELNRWWEKRIFLLHVASVLQACVITMKIMPTPVRFKRAELSSFNPDWCRHDFHFNNQACWIWICSQLLHHVGWYPYNWPPQNTAMKRLPPEDEN